MTPDTREDRPPEAQQSAGAGQINDQRPRPRGALPRGIQMWLMMGLAAVLLGIIVLTGNPKPQERRRVETRNETATLDTERIAAYQAQLRQRQQQLERDAGGPPPAPDRAQRVAASPESGTRDALDEERRRKEYDSLFVTSVVFARGGGATIEDSVPTRGRSADRSGGASDPTTTLSALDEHARQSLRRLDESVARLGLQGTGGPSDTVEERRVEGASSASGREAKAPESTSALASGSGTHRLIEGTIVDTVLMTRIDGETTGPVICLITSDVWSFNRDAVLVPKGSKVLGVAKGVDGWGQRRMAITFHRIVFPDGSTRALNDFTALEQSGATGVQDQTNRHVWSTLGAAAAVGLISGLSQAVGSGGLSGGSGDRTVVITGGSADASGQAAAQILNRFTNRLPTIVIREGHRVKLYIARDLDLPPFRDGRFLQRVSGR